jgi:tetratricopeptide (TPR) repeat protein
MDSEIAALEGLARELARLGDWGANAEAVNRRLIELAPRRTPAYTRLAKCLKERGDTEGAEALYSRVLEIDPTNLAAKNGLRRARLERFTIRAGPDQEAAPAGRGASTDHPPAHGRSLSAVASNRAGERPSEGLAVLHERLEAHFAHLNERRSDFGGGAPIFALEHGLSEAELALLRAEVCGAVRSRELLRDSWLPFVVYAAEIGYEYSGDEYWQTFETRTPHWAENGDRYYIRRKFREFRDQFRGAEPTGTWAMQFSIICWPITHAVLPTDLQRHLARLLFEYRRALTSELLDDPLELGKRLAARSWQTSSRFQNFAQNINLLGQVAVALLVGEETDSPYLLRSTLRRIVADISKEQEAWRLLRGAKSSAIQVRIRGLQRGDGGARDRGASGTTPRLPSAADPEISLRNEGAWAAYLDVPDLSVLAERLPGVHEEASRLRARVRGFAGPPLATGQLLHPGRQLKLSDWPSGGRPLIQLENGSDAVNSLLADQCVLSPGPVWVFRIRDSGQAGEVRGKFIRPGHRYVLFSQEPLPEGLPPWIATTASGTAGVYAYTVSVPDILASDELASLRSAGLGTVTDVEIWPAGLIPAVWDGEGEAEWLAGETPILAVSSSRDISKCILTLDDEPFLLDWPSTEQALFIWFPDLEVGSHSLHVSLLPSEHEQAVAEGTFNLIIRSPSTRPSTGSFREGLMLLATPVNPTLTEIWDGKAMLEILGPPGAHLSIEMTLADSSKRVLTRRRIGAALPIDSPRWAALANNFRQDHDIRRFYEEAESSVISVSHPKLGVVSLRCEREFAPLRWAPGRDAGTSYIRLVNNTEGTVAIDVSEFAFPDRPRPLEMDADSRVHWPAGGLVTARADTSTTSIVLPPDVRDFSDLERLNVRRLSNGPRSSDEVRRLIGVASKWSSASVPANLFAWTGRVNVESAIIRQLAGLIGGHRWASLEERARDSEDIRTSDLEAALSNEPYWRTLAKELLQALNGLILLSPEKRIQPFADLLARHVRRGGVYQRDLRLAEFLLRLASSPASLARIPEAEMKSAIDQVLASPILLRSARFVVLAIDATEAGGSWVWEQ